MFPFRSVLLSLSYDLLFFFFNDTATTEIYTLSLHDALPIYNRFAVANRFDRTAFIDGRNTWSCRRVFDHRGRVADRSEEHTSELQSHSDLVCRLLLEKKKNNSDARGRIEHCRIGNTDNTPLS